MQRIYSYNTWQTDNKLQQTKEALTPKAFADNASAIDGTESNHLSDDRFVDQGDKCVTVDVVLSSFVSGVKRQCYDTFKPIRRAKNDVLRAQH